LAALALRPGINYTIIFTYELWYASGEYDHSVRKDTNNWEVSMCVAERLRQFRDYRKLSQGDLEKRSGLKRCYISRVEHGHTVPSVETFEKLARGLEVPLYQLLYDGEEIAPSLIAGANQKRGWESRRTGRRYLDKLRRVLSRMSDRDRATLLFTARKFIASHRERH